MTKDCGATGRACPASDQSVIDAGKLEDAVAVVFFVAGGAAAASGAGLLIFGGRQRSETTAFRLTPIMTARSASLSLEGALW